MPLAYVINLHEPINVLSELSTVQFQTQKYLVRKKNDGTEWNKNEKTTQITIFDSSNNELDNHSKRFQDTELHDLYDKTNGLTITERIDQLLQQSTYDRKLLREAFNCLCGNKHVYPLKYKNKYNITDETHPYFNKTVTDLRNMFKIKFIDQYIFTGYEMHIINSVVNHHYVKNKIKNITWIELT